MPDRPGHTLSSVKLALAAKRARGAEVCQLAAAEPVAVIGMACRVPGGVTTPEEFWQLLMDGVDAVREVPPDRWDVNALYDRDPGAIGKMNTRWGGFIDGPALFDPQFFGIAPREASSIDPQHRLLLEVAWEALEDAGLPAAPLAGSRTGVFVAVYNPDWSEHLGTDLRDVDAYTTAGTAHCMASGRLSFLYDFHGPNLVVDTACSSSLVATHLGIRSLRDGTSDVAVVGASSLLLSPVRSVSLSRWGFMALDGRCKFADARADGWVRGEGCAVIVLKRLADALADGDRVMAVLRGSAINQDGRSTVMTAPNGLAQEAVIREALANARVDASDITYVEAHGTGTTIGDPIELEALATTYGAPRADGAPCLVGSVKSNVGHLEATAGLAGLIKTVLAVERGIIPRSLHFERLNPHVSLDGTRMGIASTACPWPGGEPRLAGVSAFGFSGTNAHVIVEEPPRLPPATPETAGPRVLVLSARAPEALRAHAEAHARVLSHADSDDEVWLRDYCYTAAVRRTHHEYRLAVVGESAADMAVRLEPFAHGSAGRELLLGEAGSGVPSRIVFVCCGQGAQWWAMGRELLAANEYLGETLARVAAALDPLTGWSLLEQFRVDESATRFTDTEVAQPAIFAIQLALAACWRRRGVVPSAVLGHSVGEVAAACISGVLTLEDAARVVYHRSRLMQRATGRGRMVSVDLPEKEARQFVGRFGGRLDTAAFNGPATSVLSGEPEAVAEATLLLEAGKIAHQALPVNYAFHSHQMDQLVPELVDALGPLVAGDAAIPLISTVTAARVHGGEMDAAYWGRNLRQPVALAAAIDRALAECGPDAVFVELGPHPVLSGAIAACIDRAGASARVLASLHRKRGERLTMATSLASLHVAGHPVDWKALFPSGGRVVSLPLYPWQHDRYWIDRPAWGAGTPGRAAPFDSGLPGRLLRSPLLRGTALEAYITAAAPAFVGDHRIGDVAVFPATGYLATVFGAAPQVLGTPCFLLTDIVFQAPLLVAEDKAVQVQTLFETTGDRTTVRVASADDNDGNRWTDHMQGFVVPDSGCVATDVVLDIDGIRGRCSEEIGGDAHYADLARRGYGFSNSFRGLKRVWHGDGEALARVELPGEHPEPPDGLPFHPGLLDGCIQAAIEALSSRLSAADESAWLPLSVASVGLRGPVGTVAWGHVAVCGGQAPDRRSVDVQLAADDGRVLVSLERLVLVRAAASSLTVAAAGRASAAHSWLHEEKWVEIPRPDVSDGVAAGHWLVFADRGGIGERLASSLESAGGAAALVSAGAETRQTAPSRWLVRGEAADEVRDVLDRAGRGHAWRGVVFLWGLDTQMPPLESAGAMGSAVVESYAGLLHLTQGLLSLEPTQIPRLSIVTRGALPVAGQAPESLFQAPLWGFARSLVLEHPELGCRRIDLDPRSDVTVAEELLSELLADDSEDEVGWRSGCRYASRLTRISERDAKELAVAAEPSGTGLTLQITERGTLENLALAVVPRRPPGAGELAVRVAAASLNFRDVLNALGMYPGDPGPLGNEVSGTVTAVGEAVEGFTEGDEVVSLCAGGFATHVTVSAALTARKPAGVPFDVAASTPIAFLTALYGLTRLAGMRAGDRVLVHAGAGGVGIAAVRLAMRAGAEVFATAGSESKRDFLRGLGVRHVMDSRTTSFADEVMAATSGRGVDIVLNSLTGEFIPKSLSVLARDGRFIEIGKSGIWDPSRVAGERPDVSYHVLYLGDVFVTDPALIRGMLDEVLADLDRGRLAALPLTRFPLERATDAFRYMAQARHTGKIVLLPRPAPTASHGRVSVPIRADATYLVTGGLGALGRHVARGLVERGARVVVLVGRRPPNEDALEGVATMEAKGARVVVLQADVSNRDDVARLFSELDEHLPPLAGIVHAAGVVDDGVVAQQTWARFSRVLAPKMTAAWLLHRMTRSRPLDFMVFFSSVASVLGSPGQAPYAAANAFLDALAHERRRSGLPALSVNWGSWAGGGMAGSLSEHDRERFAKLGFGAIEPLAGTDLLFRLLGTPRPQLTVAPIAWPTYLERYASRQRPARFLLLAETRTGGDGGRASGDVHPAAAEDLRSRALAVPVPQRLPLVMAVVREEASTVLGLPSPARLDVMRGLRDAGLDSLMAVELRNRLQTVVGRALPATLAFDHPTVDDLARYLAGDVLSLDLVSPAVAEPGAEDADPGVRDGVGGMSDAEAEAQLAAELAALEESRRGDRDV